MWSLLGKGILGGVAGHVGAELARGLGGYLRPSQGEAVGGCIGGDCGCEECEITTALRDMGSEVGGYHAMLGGYAEEAIYARRDKRIATCRKKFEKETGSIPAFVGSSRIEAARQRRDECILAAHRDAEKELAEYRASIEAAKSDEKIKAAERIAAEAREMAAKAARQGRRLVSTNILRAARTVSKAAVEPPQSPEAPPTSALVEAVRLLASMREVFGAPPVAAPPVASAPPAVPSPASDPIVVLLADNSTVADPFEEMVLEGATGSNACATGRCG